jgi:hypothetical protein
MQNANVGGLIRGVGVLAYIRPVLGPPGCRLCLSGTVPVLMCGNTQTMVPGRNTVRADGLDMLPCWRGGIFRAPFHSPIINDWKQEP